MIIKIYLVILPLLRYILDIIPIAGIMVLFKHGWASAKLCINVSKDQHRQEYKMHNLVFHCFINYRMSFTDVDKGLSINNISSICVASISSSYQWYEHHWKTNFTLKIFEFKSPQKGYSVKKGVQSLSPKWPLWVV